MEYLKHIGWKAAAVALLVLAVGVMLAPLDSKSKNSPASVFMLVGVAFMVWKNEKSRRSDWASKKIAMLSATMLTVFAMDLNAVDEFVRTLLGISGVVASVFLVVPAMIWFMREDLRAKVAEEQALEALTGKRRD
jgi:FtsH-binding integral membrane protein